MADKRYEFPGTQGDTYYGVIRQRSSGKVREFADGSWTLTPANKIHPFSPIVLAPGTFELVVAAPAWTDDDYPCTVYRQVGGAADPDVDVAVNLIQMRVEGDAEVAAANPALSAVVEAVRKALLNKMILDPVAKTLTVYENDGIVAYKVFDLVAAGPVEAFTSRTPR